MLLISFYFNCLEKEKTTNFIEFHSQTVRSLSSRTARNRSFIPLLPRELDGLQIDLPVLRVDNTCALHSFAFAFRQNAYLERKKTI